MLTINGLKTIISTHVYFMPTPIRVHGYSAVNKKKLECQCQIVNAINASRNI